MVLPGVTRDSVLDLAAAHSSETYLPFITSSTKVYPQETSFSMDDLRGWAANGRLEEAFCVGTAVVVASIGRICEDGREPLVLPEQQHGMGPVAHAMYTRIIAIQEGREVWKDWSVSCL